MSKSNRRLQLLAAVVAVLAVTLVFAAVRVFGVGNTISGEDARRLVEDGARLVDVRSPAEFEDRHIPNAVNIPVDALDGHLDELQPRDEPIVVYCRSGARSTRAKNHLEAAGFSQVHNLGAMSRW